MIPAARVSAAIEVLADIAARKRPASETLKDWGLAHRFAGSGDRAAIGNLVFDALRHRASNAYAMKSNDPRALVLRTLVSGWGMTPEAVSALADGSRFAPEPLTPVELAGLKRTIAADAPAHIRGDYPEWLAPLFLRAFDGNAAEEGAALSRRAPLLYNVGTSADRLNRTTTALEAFRADSPGKAAAAPTSAQSETPPASRAVVTPCRRSCAAASSITSA